MEINADTLEVEVSTYSVLYSYATTDRYYRGQRGCRVTATSQADALAQIRRGTGGYSACPSAEIVRCKVIDSPPLRWHELESDATSGAKVAAA